MLLEIENHSICQGVINPQVSNTTLLEKHVCPKRYNPTHVWSNQYVDISDDDEYNPHITSLWRITLTLRKRADNKELQNQVALLQNMLRNNSIPVTEYIHKDIQDILNHVFENIDNKWDVSEFAKLILKEQMKYLIMSPEQMQYHPMIIKYALDLHARSPTAYELLRLKNDGTGILVLPSKRTLCDYINYIRPKRGFDGDITTELREKKTSVKLRYLLLML